MTRNHAPLPWPLARCLRKPTEECTRRQAACPRPNATRLLGLLRGRSGGMGLGCGVHASCEDPLRVLRCAFVVKRPLCGETLPPRGRMRCQLAVTHPADYHFGHGFRVHGRICRCAAQPEWRAEASHSFRSLLVGARAQGRSTPRAASGLVAGGDPATCEGDLPPCRHLSPS